MWFKREIDGNGRLENNKASEREREIEGKIFKVKFV
jgi:hypothetical protein